MSSSSSSTASMQQKQPASPSAVCLHVMWLLAVILTCLLFGNDWVMPVVLLLQACVVADTLEDSSPSREQHCCSKMFAGYLCGAVVHSIRSLPCVCCLQEAEEAYDRITELCKRLFKVSCRHLQKHRKGCPQQTAGSMRNADKAA
jgi:hypothetical protein